MTPEARGIQVRLDAIRKLIEEQQTYLAKLIMREERLKLDLRIAKRKN